MQDRSVIMSTPCRIYRHIHFQFITFSFVVKKTRLTLFYCTHFLNLIFKSVYILLLQTMKIIYWVVYPFAYPFCESMSFIHVSFNPFYLLCRCNYEAIFKHKVISDEYINHNFSFSATAKNETVTIILL